MIGTERILCTGFCQPFTSLHTNTNYKRNQGYHAGHTTSTLFCGLLQEPNLFLSITCILISDIHQFYFFMIGRETAETLIEYICLVIISLIQGWLLDGSFKVLHWSSRNIPYDGIPFIFVPGGRLDLQCHQGKDKNRYRQRKKVLTIRISFDSPTWFTTALRNASEYTSNSKLQLPTYDFAALSY